MQFEKWKYNFRFWNEPNFTAGPITADLAPIDGQGAHNVVSIMGVAR